MASPAVANVAAAFPALTGGISKAPLGTALPADSTTALAAAFKGLGYVGDGGLTNTPTRTQTAVNAWGGALIANLQTDFSETYGFTLVESLNPEVQKAVWGDSNVTVTAATSTTGTLMAIKKNGLPMPQLVWSFDMFSGNGKRRIVVPLGQIAVAGDVTYNNGAVIAYPVTLTCYADAMGQTSYEYITDGVTNP